MIQTLKQTTKEIYNWTKDKVVRFKKWLVVLILGAVVVAAPLVIPPNVPDIALENIQADYHASELKDKYRLEKTAFILDAIDENAIQSEVGNKNLDKFTPELTLRKWDDEVNFKVKYKHSEKEKDQKVDIEDKKIKWKGKKVEVHYYDIKKGELLHNKVLEADSFEVEVILLEKPDTNIIGFDIETMGLAFYYQPALNLEDNPEADYCTETDCYKDGEVITHRPENVVGSYAVYHESKSGDYSQMAGKNYMAGKAFHIYRPKIIDSAGIEVWGKLNITDNLLTVEIPQEFLDNAVYPVRHAAGLTFGYEVLGTDLGVIGDNYMATKFTMGGVNGTGDSISVGLRNWGSGEKIKCAIYDSSRNLVTNGTTEERTTGGAEAFYTFDFISSPNLTASAEYWLFVWAEDTNVVVQGDGGDVNQLSYYGLAYNGFPASIGVGNYNYKASIYCTYTAGGAAERRMFLTQ